MFACLFVSVWSIQAISLKTGFQPLDVFFFLKKRQIFPDLYPIPYSSIVSCGSFPKENVCEAEKRKWQIYVSFGI